MNITMVNGQTITVENATVEIKQGTLIAKNSKGNYIVPLISVVDVEGNLAEVTIEDSQKLLSLDELKKALESNDNSGSVAEVQG